jgi:hypothetical protein
MTPWLKQRAWFASFLVLTGCPQPANDLDGVRRAVVRNEVALSAPYPRSRQPWICLAVRDRFDAGAGTYPMDADRGGLLDPPPDFIDGLWREKVLQGVKFSPVSECSGWFGSSAREQGALLVLVENIEFKDASHATAEMERWVGQHGNRVLFMLEKQGGQWKVVGEDVVSEG